MANDIQLKRSSVSGRIPDAANILVGEPVVNLTDKIIFTKDGSGTVIVIGAGTTSNVAEGNNLYFTNTRAVSAFTAGSGVSIAANGRITATVTSNGGGSSGVTTSSFSNTNLFLNTIATIFTFDSTVYRTADVTFSIDDGLNFTAIKNLVVHNGTNIAYSNTITSTGVFDIVYYYEKEGNYINLKLASPYASDFFSEAYVAMSANIKGDVNLFTI